MDSVSDFESGGCGFESRIAYSFSISFFASCLPSPLFSLAPPASPRPQLVLWVALLAVLLASSGCVSLRTGVGVLQHAEVGLLAVAVALLVSKVALGVFVIERL